MHYLVWDAPTSRANDLLRDLMRQAKYKWAWKKLNSARWHIIETHTLKVDECQYNGESFVSNGDAEALPSDLRGELKTL